MVPLRFQMFFLSLCPVNSKQCDEGLVTWSSETFVLTNDMVAIC
uniref:Uncharacterized protein n=1 Tax=Arundo donax TaxID=35708 RepID=A0A0A9H7K2_ARUDO